MFHTMAWYSAAPTAAALTPLAGVREEQIFTSGNDQRVPDFAPNIIGEVAMAANAITQAQVQAPSLRSVVNLDVIPVASGGLHFNSPPAEAMHPECPVPVVPSEAMDFAVNAAAAAAHCYGLVWLADGSPQAVTGQMFTVRFTATITAVLGAWTNGGLTFAQTFPAGVYAVIGASVFGASCVAARFLFAGQTARPGIMARTAVGDKDYFWNRYGRLGVMGQFSNTLPPTMDVLDDTAGANTYDGVLDVIRVK